MIFSYAVAGHKLSLICPGIAISNEDVGGTRIFALRISCRCANNYGVAVNINRPFMNGRYFGMVSGKQLPEWAADFDCESWAQFVLKFIVAHPAVNCVLTETADPKHAIDNLGAGYGGLPDLSTQKKMLELIRDL